MRSVLFRIPLPFKEPWDSLAIHGYGLMILVGFFAAVFVASKESRRRGLPDFVYDLGLVMLISGVVGGRLFHYVQFYETSYAGKSFFQFFKIWEGGLVFYGGAIFGFLAGWVFIAWKKLPLADCLDVSALGVPLGMAFGRLGCFLHGCCFGMRCDPDYAMGVVFPNGSPVHRFHWDEGLLLAPTDPPLPVHPVQLYQAGHDFLLFGILFVYLRQAGTPRGLGMPLLFAMYGLGRFFLEGLRGDHAPSFTGLTWGQNLSISLFLVFGGILTVILLRNPSPRQISEASGPVHKYRNH